MNNPLVFIVDTVFDVVSFLFLARLILQASRADFYNPISQGIVKATDPILRPMRIVIPGYRNIDFAAFIAAWLIKVLAYVLSLGIQSQFMPGVFSLFAIGLYDVLRLLLTVYWFALIIVIVLSFLAPGSYHPAAALLSQVTEPILAPARRLIPPLGGLDFSPILVFMILILIRDYLLKAIFATLLTLT
jgi:YggT family protein